MNAIGMEALTQSLTLLLVPKIRRELKQHADGSLPGERERVAAFDTANVLLLGYLADLKTALRRAQREASRLTEIADTELSAEARRELDRHRTGSEE